MNARGDHAGNQEAVERALLAISDDQPVAWQEIRQHVDDRAQFESLRLLDDLAHAYRDNAARIVRPVDRPPPLFRWGPMDVIESLGNGRYGEVYRAFDPWLQREVALKLFRSEASDGFTEARRLARLRHPGVLAVYGCAVHDGRAGMWSELIEGRTLAERVRDDGPCSSEETLRIARDLAYALAAVHAIGLVHGDVKAENVMRERGGRIVLMDFGAGGDDRLQASRKLVSATLRYLPPEVLSGAPLSAHSDVFALGVLMFYLRCGTLPWTETDAEQLLRTQHAGSMTPLPTPANPRDATAQALIARGIAPDPAARPASATELATALDSALTTPAVVRARRSHNPWVIAALLMLAALMASIWYRGTSVPLSVDVAFVHVAAGGEVPIANGSTVSIGDRLRLRLSTSTEAYAYVLNEDSNGTATVLFPLDSAGLRNPLAAGSALQLPGVDPRSPLAWQVTDDSVAEEFVVVTSAQPLTALDAALAEWKRARFDRESADPLRSVETLVSEAEGVMVDGAQLKRALQALERAGSPAHRVWYFRFPHAAASRP